ncbi:hypothetical protein OS493_002202, partial [Desmophyllum pertusum]
SCVDMFKCKSCTAVIVAAEKRSQKYGEKATNGEIKGNEKAKETEPTYVNLPSKAEVFNILFSTEWNEVELWGI